MKSSHPHKPHLRLTVARTYEDSIAQAKAANAREREAVYQQTGLRIDADGKVVIEKKDAVSA